MGNKWIKQKEEDCRCYDSSNLPPRKRHAKLMKEAQKVYKMERPSSEIERLRTENASLKKELEIVHAQYDEEMVQYFKVATEIVFGLRDKLDAAELENEELRQAVYALLDHKKEQRQVQKHSNWMLEQLVNQLRSPGIVRVD